MSGPAHISEKEAAKIKNYEKAGFLVPVELGGLKDVALLADTLVRRSVPVFLRGALSPALETVRLLRRRVPEGILGLAGDLRPEDCREARSSGVDFVVLPRPERERVELCRGLGLEVLAECSREEELALACELEVGALAAGKLSPEELSGLKKRFPGVRMAVRAEPGELGELVAHPAVGTTLADWIWDGERTQEELLRECATAEELVLGFSLAHVGINTPDEDSCRLLAAELGRLFGFSRRDNGNSIYASDQLEVMKFMQRGAMGHLGIRTNSASRAAEVLKRKGLTAIESTKKYRDGKLSVVYFEEQLGGFGIHLIQRVVG